MNAYTTAAIMYGISVAANALTGQVNNVSNSQASYELDSRSIAEARQGEPSWRVFRKRVWQNEAKYNISSYDNEQLNRMIRGLAPKINGKSMHLHHVFGKQNDLYTVVKLTQQQHILFHKTFGFHVNSSWNWDSIISLFG